MWGRKVKKPPLNAGQLAQIIGDPPDIHEENNLLRATLVEIRVREPKRRFKQLIGWHKYEPWAHHIRKRQLKCHLCGELGPIY